MSHNALIGKYQFACFHYHGAMVAPLIVKSLIGVIMRTQIEEILSWLWSLDVGL